MCLSKGYLCDHSPVHQLLITAHYFVGPSNSLGDTHQEVNLCSKDKHFTIWTLEDNP